jgi:hypothetical protein
MKGTIFHTGHPGVFVYITTRLVITINTATQQISPPGIVLGNFIFVYLGVMVMPFCDALLIEVRICISIQ